MKIIRDTREKVGYWAFGDEEVVEKKLESGDYSLEGYEHILCIERKKTVNEIAVNIGTDRVRFNKELERMKEFPLAYLICEFSIDDVIRYPEGSTIPAHMRKRVRIGGKYIMKVLNSYERDYGIKVIFAGDRATAIEYAMEIFEDAQKNKI